MTTPEKIVHKLQVLETLSKQGAYSDNFARSIEKIITQEINTLQHQIEAIETDLQKFENHYQLSSEQFYQQFKAGQLGDEIDFVEWSAFYQMWANLQERLNLLQSQL